MSAWLLICTKFDVCGAGMFVLMFTLVAGQEELQRLEEEKVEFDRREKLHVSDIYFCKTPLLKVSRPRMNEPEQGYAALYLLCKLPIASYRGEVSAGAWCARTILIRTAA